MRTLAAQLALLALLPFNAAVTLLALLRGRRPQRAVAAEPKTVLVSGGKMTKALQLCRSFHAAGHRVILVETRRYRFTGHRFSRAVDRFLTVPAPDAPGYAAALREIVRREGVDVYVPVCAPAASLPDAETAAALGCEVFSGSADEVRMLDDKFAFSQTAAELGLAVPEHHRITAPEQVQEVAGGPFVLKSIPYDPVRRLDLTPDPAGLPISEARPWILQGFVAGTEYCTHSTVRDGHVRLHACCASSAFQLNYAHVDKPDIEAWVRRFVGALGLTGQFSFDFIEAADGTVRAIECNPRTHSAITMFHDDPRVAAAYLEAGEGTVEPRPDARPTYWLYHELWRLVSAPGRRATLRRILTGRDAVFAWDDPLPFLVLHHVQIPWLLLRSRGWIRIDFNIGKLVEAGGD